VARKRFTLPAAQRIVAEKELKLYEDALMHDHQYAVRRAIYLMQVLALPKRIRREDAIKLLVEKLGLLRERNRWGRPWTYSQIRRVFYMRSAWRERSPRPVNPAEWKAAFKAGPPQGRISVENGPGGKPRLKEMPE